MGKAKVPNGVRLNVKLPAEYLKRLKIECIERQMLESSIVLEALQKHWTSEPQTIHMEADPVWDCLTPDERETVAARMVADGKGKVLEKVIKPYLELDRGAQAIVQIMKAAGVDPYKSEPSGGE